MSDKNPEKGTVCFSPFGSGECDSSILETLGRYITETDRKAASAASNNADDLTDEDIQGIRKLIKAFDASFPVIDRLLAAQPCKEILRNDLGVFAILAGLQIMFEKVAWALQSSAASNLEWHRLGAMIEKLRQVGIMVGKEVYVYIPMPQEATAP